MALTVRVTESRPFSRTVFLEGRLNNETVGVLDEELNAVVNSPASIVVFDLAGLEYISSAGLRAILVAAKLVQVHGGAMKICDANTTVKQVMEVSGMSSLLHLYATEKDALAAFSVG